MNSFLFILLISFINQSTQVVNGKTPSINEIPVKLSSCKVKLSNKKVIDLTSLDRPDSPR